MNNSDVLVEDVKRAIKSALTYFDKGFYKPLHARYPLYVDEAVPKSMKSHLDDNSTCAATDGNHVFFDSENGSKMISLARKKMLEKKKVQNWYFDEVPYDDVYTIIAHEYTHILMEHVKRGKKFVKQHGMKNFRTFQLACDIEANRGYGVSQSSSVYGIGVTDATFPETREVYGLMNIYETLLKYHKDDIDDEFNDAQEEMGNDESENGQGDSDRDSETQSESSQEAQEDGSDRKNDKSSKSKSNSLTDAQKKAIRNSIKDYEEMEKEIDEYDDESDSSDGSIDDEENEERLSNGSPSDVLKRAYNDEIRKNTKDVMKNLRNIVSGGNQIRERTKTYSRPSRRDGEDGLMRKGIKNAKVKAPKILIGMDSSGSMQETTMQKVVDAIGNIIDELGRDKKGSYICEHEEYVKNMNDLKDWKKVVENYYPEGGNDFNELLRVALQKDVDVVLNIGDGCDRITSSYFIKKAKERNLVWYDIIISDCVTEEHVIEDYYDHYDKNSEYHFDRKSLKIVL